MLLDGVPFLAGDTGELNFESVPMGMVDRIEVVRSQLRPVRLERPGGADQHHHQAHPREAGDRPQDVRRHLQQLPRRAVEMVRQDPLLQRPVHPPYPPVGDLGVALFFSRQTDDSYRQNDYNHSYNFFLKTHEDDSPTSSFTLDFGLAWQDQGQFLFWRNIDSALIPPANHASDNMISIRYYFNGLYNGAVSDRLCSRSRRSGTTTTGGTNPRGLARTESRADEYRLDALTTVLLGDRQTLTAGVDGNIDLIGGDIFGDRRIGGLALYGQDEIRLTPEVTLTLGVRFDFQSVGLTSEAGQLNPKAGLTYAPVEGTTFRASFGQGFRVPSLPEAFVAAGTTSLQAVPNGA